MSVRLIDRPYREVQETVRLLTNHPKFSAELGELIRKANGADRALDALVREFFPTEAVVVPIPKTEAKAFPTWRRIKIGTHKSVEELVMAIEAKGFKIDGMARYISKNVALAEKVSEVELVRVTLRELDFERGAATCKDIYDRAISFSLSLCPAEVGLQLRLQYEDQRRGEWLSVAMEHIADSDGVLRVFSVAHDGFDRCLYTNNGHPAPSGLVVGHWVFLRSKQ